MNAYRLLLPSALLVCTAFFCCCDSGTGPEDEIVFPETDVSYTQHVQPYFTRRCATSGCHDDQNRAGNLSLTSWINTTARVGVVIPNDSQSSLLVQKIDGRLPHPPEVPILINENQVNGIKSWIDAGAKLN